jgi:hypothetical protein
MTLYPHQSDPDDDCMAQITLVDPASQNRIKDVITFFYQNVDQGNKLLV